MIAAGPVRAAVAAAPSAQPVASDGADSDFSTVMSGTAVAAPVQAGKARRDHDVDSSPGRRSAKDDAIENKRDRREPTSAVDGAAVAAPPPAVAAPPQQASARADDRPSDRASKRPDPASAMSSSVDTPAPPAVQARPQQQPLPDAAAAPVLAALTEAANGAAATTEGGSDAAEPPSGLAKASTVPEPASMTATAVLMAARGPVPGGAGAGKGDGGSSKDDRKDGDAPAASPGAADPVLASKPSSAGTPAPPAVQAQPRQQPPLDAAVAPAVAALTEAANGAATTKDGPDAAAPSSGLAKASTAPEPVGITATAVLMAARGPVSGGAGAGKGDGGSSRDDRKDGDAPAAPPGAADPVLASDFAATVPASPTAATPTAHPAAAGAAATLGAQGADRQLDLAKQNAWLDGLAHDIAAAGGAAGGTMRFQVAPQHLGTVQVALSQTADGASVTLTAASEASRALLADARPQLVADARMHGLHIASAEVRAAADTQSASSDSRGGAAQSQSDPRQGGGFSSQAGGTGADRGGSQTRSQPIAFTTDPDARPPVLAQDAGAPAAAGADDGLYA